MASSQNIAAPNTYAAVRSFAERRYWPEMALLAVTLITFAMTVSFGFIYDDRHSVVDMQAIHGIDGLTSCFTQNIAAVHGSNLYRPVPCSLQRVSFLVVDGHAGGWHVISVLLHALNVLLVFRFAKLLLRDGFVALVAAALFAVHPIHLEPVVWISAVADPLMTLFLLAAGILWLRWAERHSFLWWLGAFSAGSIAVLCKEPAVVLPVLLLITAFAVPAERRRSIGGLALGALPFVAVDAAYLIARHNVLKVVIAHGASVPTTTAEMIYTLPSVLWFHLRQLVLPTGLSLSYPIDAQHTWMTPGFVLPLIGLGLAVALIGWFIQRSEQRAQLCVAMAWLILPLAPVLYLKAFVKFEFVHDRFVYAPSIGFCILAAAALTAAGNLLSARSESAKLAFPAAVVALAFVVTLVNLPVFRNDVAVFTRAVEVTPDNASMVLDLGTVLLEQKDYAQGIPLIERAMELRPTDASAAYNRGRAAWELGDNPTAERYFVRALQLHYQPEYLIQFVSVEIRLGKLGDAEAAAREALRLDPRVENGHLALGAVLFEKGDRTGAAEEFKQQLILDPSNRGAQMGLQRLAGK